MISQGINLFTGQKYWYRYKNGSCNEIPTKAKHVTLSQDPPTCVTENGRLTYLQHCGWLVRCISLSQSELIHP